MTPGARLQSAIEILDALDTDSRPADRFMRGWFRARRYVGSKDRRTIMRRVYTVLRSRARLDWWCGRHLSGIPVANRTRVIASLVLTDGIDENTIASLFDGGTYRPPVLSAAERTLINALDSHLLDSTEQPAPVRGEYPGWLDDALHRRFDGAVVNELQALNQSAPVDIRVNRLKSTSEAVRASLSGAGIEGETLPISPIGLRMRHQPRLEATRAYRDGLFEIQDEGSQIVALMSDVEPGQLVVDYCAGAGGKTLALAASMEGRGRLIAYDRDPARLAKMDARLKRAGCAEFVDRRGGDVTVLDEFEGRADRVLLDVPCSTSGAWRRDPAAKWRLTQEEMGRLVGLQRAILSEAAGLVRSGGRLVYATCSILDEENESQAEWFCETHDAFTLVPATEVWNRIFPHVSPPSAEATLRLTPARTGTDGFFVAIFERRQG